MTAQEKLDKLMAEAEKLKAIIEKTEKTKEERFFDLIQGLTAKWNLKEYPDSIVYYKGDKFWLQYNQKSGSVLVRYPDFWEVFEKEFDLNYQETRDFLKGLLEEHFKWKGVTPFLPDPLGLALLEEHFKWKGVTPNGAV